MEFYSFRFGEMEVAQADAASPKTMAVEMKLGFKNPERHTVEAIAVTVHVPHDPDKSVSAAEKAAYGIAQALLESARAGSARTESSEAPASPTHSSSPWWGGPTRPKAEREGGRRAWRT